MKEETPEQREARLKSQRAYAARQREKDPEGFKARGNAASRKSAVRHPERRKAAVKKWRDANREAWNKTRREYRIKNIMRWLCYQAKRRAKERGIEFTITPCDIPPMGECCPLLGRPFVIGEGRNIDSPSLDRINPARGYVPGNVWIVGYRANLIKNDGTAKEHEMIARAMREALKLRRPTK